MLGAIALPSTAVAIAARAAVESDATSSSSGAALLSVKEFGAVGDGKADDSAALQRAFAAVGRQIFLPKGTYKASNLGTPQCAAILGEGELHSIIQIMSGSGLSLGSDCKVHRDYQMTGNAAQGAIGLHFGGADIGAYSVENVRIRGFVGAGATGIRYNKCLKSVFINVTAEDNQVNELWHGDDATFPTTLLHLGGVSTGAIGEGSIVRTGAAITIIGRDFESSGREGLLLQPSGTAHLEGIAIEGCWFEDNWKKSPVLIADGGSGYAKNDRLQVIGGTSSAPMVLRVDAVGSSGAITAASIVNPGMYTILPSMPFAVSGGRGDKAHLGLGTHIRLDDSGDNTRKVWPSIHECRFSMDVNTARAILLEGAGCNPTITNEWLAAIMCPSIIMQRGAAATFPFASNRYDYSIVVSDAGNRASWAMTGWRDFTPVIGTLGRATEGPAETFEINHARFRRQGKTLDLSVNFAGSLASPKAARLALTIPNDIQIAFDAAFSVQLEIAGRRQTGALIADAKANRLFIETENRAWDAGRFVLSFNVQFEIR